MCILDLYPCYLSNNVSYENNSSYEKASGFTFGEESYMFNGIKVDGSKSYVVARNFRLKTIRTMIYIIEGKTVTIEKYGIITDTKLYLPVTKGNINLMSHGLVLTTPNEVKWILDDGEIADIVKCKDHVYVLMYKKKEIVIFDEKTMLLLGNIRLIGYINGHIKDRLIKFMDRFYISS